MKMLPGLSPSSGRELSYLVFPNFQSSLLHVRLPDSSRPSTRHGFPHIPREKQIIVAMHDHYVDTETEAPRNSMTYSRSYEGRKGVM